MIKSFKSVERNLLIGFIAALSVAATVCTMFYYSVSNYLEDNRMVIHTGKVIENIEELSAELNEIQVMRRNFVLSGNENSLKDYEAEIQRIDDRISLLRLLVGDNPVQHERIDTLASAILERRELAGQVLAMRRSGNFEEAGKMILSEANQKISERIEKLLDQLKDEERRLLNIRTENLIDSQQNTLSIIVAWGTMAFIVIIFGYFFVRVIVRKRHLVRQELRTREGLYRTLVRNIPKTAVVLLDKDMRYTLADGEQLNEHGFSQETFEGKTIYDVFPPEVSKEWITYYKRAFDGERITLEQKKDHNYFVTNVLPIENEDGEIFSVMVMWQDITERKEAEAEQDRLLQILDSSEDFIAMFSIEKDEVIYTNRAGKRMIGKNEDDAPEGMSIGKHHPKWAAELVFNEAFPTAIKNGFWFGETAFIGMDKQEIPTSQMIISHRDEKGDVKYLSTVARDISKSKQIEKALRKSERFNRDLIDKSPGYICMQTIEGVLLSVNPAAANALGYKPEEVVGRSISDFLQPQVKPFFSKYLDEIRAKGELSGQFHLLTKDGEPRIWQFKNVLYENAENGIYVLGHAQDVTESIRVEQELRESRQMFEKFMNNSPAVSYIKDEAGRFIYASRHLSDLFQAPLEEIYGRTDADFMPLETAEEIRAKEENIVKTGKVEETVDSIPMADGRLHVWQSYKFPIDYGFGKKMLGGVSFDITEHQKMEQLLHRTVTIQRAILNSANYTVISTDPGGIIQSFNKTAEAWLGYKTCEVVGVQTPALIHISAEIDERADYLTKQLGYEIEPDFDTLVAKARLQPVDEGEWMYVRKDGTTFPVLLSVTAVRDDDGTITGFLFIGSDITERKQMERDLKNARDAALESARLKSEFLANMSHEIRTPMNGIIGMSELILQTDLNPEQREYAETVQSSGTSLLTIINDILDFSKIESGKLHFETVDFDVQYTIDSVMELFAAPAEQKKLEFASLVYSDVPTALRGDPGRVRQILTNLVGNAIKFTEKGEVVVRVKVESETETHTTLSFSVTDSGIGISEESRRSLFNAFVQADGSITRRFGGTGLGLAISKQLTAMMHGEIGVDSALGKGSTFWFTAVFEKQPERKAATPRYDLSGLRVLVVDDNATNRKFIAAQTTFWKMDPSSVDSGRAAIEELRRAAHEEKPYDIAIIDLMMPEMDGFTLGEEIKKDSLISKTRLLLMPSYGTRGHSQKAKKIGIDAYVVKPVSQSDLYNCLADIFAETNEAPAAQATAKEAKALITRHSVEENIRRREKEFLILVAEDNLVNQKVIRRQIENLGYTADIVSNGQEALDAYSMKDYNLIFMDCQMPVLDGFSTTEQIRQLEQSTSRHIPIVALTASAIQGDREKCIEAGMDEYISKPTNQEKINEIINHFMDADDTSNNQADE